MKTAISVPDAVFLRVEQASRRLGISRSEFFSRAAERWADDLDKDDLTDLINAALDGTAEDENSEFLRTAAERSLLDEGSD